MFRDPVSAASHWLGVVLSIFVCFIFWQLTRHRRSARPSVMIFGLSMIMLYTASATFHSLRLSPEELRPFQKLDMSCIYLLIAGTYTPIMAILLQGRWRNGLLILMWTLAFVGIFCQWALPRAPYTMIIVLYLAVGWIGFLGLKGYLRAIGWRGLRWGLWGGLFYTAGAIMESTGWPVLIPGVIQHHEMLHILDLFGTAIHVGFVIKYVIPYSPMNPVKSKQDDESSIYSSSERVIVN